MKTSYPYKLKVGQEILGRMGEGIVKYRVTKVIDDVNIEVGFMSFDIDSESDEPNGQDPDGTTDLGLEPLEEEWNEEEDWCAYCQMDVEGDEAGNCPHCGNLITLIEETDYLEEDDE